MWFFFPEAREIEASNWLGSWVRSLLRFEMQGSNDTTNGMDGTWETAVFPSGTPMGSHTVPSWWRIYVKPVSFSTTYKTIRIKFELYSSYDGTPILEKLISMEEKHMDKPLMTFSSVMQTAMRKQHCWIGETDLKALQ